MTNIQSDGDLCSGWCNVGKIYVLIGDMWQNIYVLVEDKHVPEHLCSDWINVGEIYVLVLLYINATYLNNISTKPYSHMGCIYIYIYIYLRIYNLLQS